MRIVGNQEIDFNEHIWRYFKTERFVEFLNTSKLYFASARQFNDPFEGAVAVLPPGFPIDPRYSKPEPYEKACEELKRLTKINCWHRAKYESNAMWHLYADSGKGVAIQSTPERIKAAAEPFRLKPNYGHEDLLAGNVNYVNLLELRLPFDMHHQFWHKHLAFSWEQEFRLAISLRMAEEFGVDVPELGIFVEFNLDSLIEQIYLGPSLKESDIAEIRHAAEHCGFSQRINISSLLGTPRYY